LTKLDSIAISQEAQSEDITPVDSTRQHLEAAFGSPPHDKTQRNDRLFQHNRHNSLTAPGLSSTATLETLLPSPSSDGEDMANLRPSASTSASWASSSMTLPMDETEPLLYSTSHHTRPGQFAFTADELVQMFDQRSLDIYKDVGGLARLAKGLRTNLSLGLKQNESFHEMDIYGSTFWRTPTGHNASEPFAERTAAFGENKLPERKSKTLIQLMLIAISDRVLLLLSIVSLISLSLGLYQAFGQPHEPGQPRVEWVEGLTIMTAVAIAVIVGALNDYQKERQFVKLNRKVSFAFRLLFS
jgi:magnesium-transporting ATPase (P-type)